MFLETFWVFFYFFKNLYFLKGKVKEKMRVFLVYFSSKLGEKTKEKALKKWEKNHEKKERKMIKGILKNK